MTNEEIIEVVTAANNGSTIECKRKFDTNKTWHVCNSPAWDFYNYEYRAKPKILRHKVSAVLIGTKEEIEYALDTGDFSDLILQILNNEEIIMHQRYNYKLIKC